MKYRIIIVVVVITCLVFSLSPSREGITVCDVGQGDASIINLGTEGLIISDCGPDDKILSCLAGEIGYWKKDISALIISHPHADHFSGCFSLLERYQVRKIFVSSAPVNDPGYAEFITLAKEQGVSVSVPASGDELVFSQECRLRFLRTSYEGNNLNNFSLGFKFVCGGTSFLSLGDLEKEEELSLSGDLSADILKVSHHGADTSSAIKFLEKVSPRIAIISVGENNRYGHPAVATLENLTRLSALIWRTDIKGAFNFFADFR